MPHDEGRPHGQPVYTPLKSFEEIFKEKREREMREAGHRPPDGAFRAYVGTDYLGRPYDDIEQTGAWRERPELKRRKR